MMFILILLYSASHRVFDDLEMYSLAYGPCLNSVDPHCITHDALECLPCEEYAVCAPCAPGWDAGCISVAPHENATCDSPAMMSPNNATIAIPYQMDGGCYWHNVCLMKLESK